MAAQEPCVWRPERNRRRRTNGRARLPQPDRTALPVSSRSRIAVAGRSRDRDRRPRGLDRNRLPARPWPGPPSLRSPPGRPTSASPPDPGTAADIARAAPVHVDHRRRPAGAADAGAAPDRAGRAMPSCAGSRDLQKSGVPVPDHGPTQSAARRRSAGRAGGSRTSATRRPRRNGCAASTWRA